MSVEWAVQKAIFARLAADAAIAAAVGGRIADFTPEREVFPYITLDDAGSADWSTDTDVGYAHLPRVHVWSRAEGRKEARTIAARIRALFDRQPLTLEVGRAVLVHHQSTSVVRDPDGLTTHAVVTFRTLLEEN